MNEELEVSTEQVQITQEQALEEVRSLAFPFAEQDDTVEYESFTFIYNQGQWESTSGTN